VRGYTCCGTFLGWIRSIRSVNVVVLPIMPVEAAAAVVIIVIPILYFAPARVDDMIG
jgi:hypothetical protein